MLDSRGLIPYLVDDNTGHHYQPSRGIGNSHVLIYAPALWPEQAKQWYQLYEEHFWQDGGWAPGFREFPRDIPNKEWIYDVDAVPADLYSFFFPFCDTA